MLYSAIMLCRSCKQMKGERFYDKEGSPNAYDGLREELAAEAPQPMMMNNVDAAPVTMQQPQTA